MALDLLLTQTVVTTVFLVDEAVKALKRHLSSADVRSNGAPRLHQRPQMPESLPAEPESHSQRPQRYAGKRRGSGDVQAEGSKQRAHHRKKK